MVERLIELSAKHKWIVFGIVLLLTAWAADSVRKTPLDALPDISDPQVIVYTEWMGRSPDLVEDQITYPLVRTLQSTPGVVTVRGYSMFGMSFAYALFNEGTDIYWARTRVLEQLGRVQQLLPPDVTPTLGPDASGVGWVYQYVLKDDTGRMDLAELRAFQDFTVRPALQAVAGVAEVASLGGFQRQYQIILDPDRLVGFGLTLGDVTRSVRDSNAEVGARVLELAGREYVLRGRGYVKDLADLEKSVVTVGPGGIPIRLGDIARVQFGPDIRRGAADYNGTGETVGGIVVMRIGSNALEVIRAIEAQTATLRLPDGVRLIPTYDRSELILGSVATLTNTLMQQAVIVTIICLVFLFHARSALVVMIVLPLSVLMSFIGIRYLGLTSNIMSLGGIAIAIGELADAVIVLIENAHVRLAAAPKESDRQRVIVDACKEVGRPIFFSLLLITISFLPIFTLAGQAGRLFTPLAYTKTFAMFAAAILSITLAPPLMVLLLRGHFRTEATNPVSRLLSAVYRPIAVLVVRFRFLVVAAALVLLIATVPVFQRLGSEFMPPLDEGSLLVMPTTFPGIAIEEARRALVAQDRIIMGFPEVQSVHGKAGRAETATDPAQLDMIESVIALRPREQWPTRYTARWYSAYAPDWAKQVALRRVWPEQESRTLAQLARDLDGALRMPGYQMAIAPPIRTRIDMLTTGVRTPAGIKVFGDDLTEIERLSVSLEGMLRQVPGTRSTFAERQTGREYVDIAPNRDAIARYGLTVRDVQDVVEAAIGGMPVSTAIAGRARFSINIRLAAGYRADPQALRALLVPVPSMASLGNAGDGTNTGAGVGASAAMGGATGASPSGGGMGMGGGRAQAGAAGPAMSASLLQPPMAGSAQAGPDFLEQWRQPGASVRLGQLAEVRVTSGPPMIKDENGVLVGYVYADIDQTRRDLGGWVNDAKAVVASQLTLPAGYRLQWTGQYEFLEAMEARLRYVIPITLVLVVALLYMAMQGWPQTFLVLSSLPFAVAGSVWLLAYMDYNLSTAVWVGLIAVAGVAAETGIVMVVYLDEAFARYTQEGRIQVPADVDAAVVEGASARVRPLLMTVATTVLGLLPLLWEGGVGADVSARTAAPVVGGLWSCLFLTLLVLPAGYAMWRRGQVRASMAAAPVGPGTVTTLASSGQVQASTPLGLSVAEAAQRLVEFGHNEIRREQATSPLTLLARQFSSPVIWLLLGAAIISALFAEFLDAGAIGAIVVVNAVIGFLQEHRAERAVMALRSMTAPRARVRRDGQSVMVPASTVVPGDVLVFEAGDIAAADARLLTAHALTTNEAALTGESTPVEKRATPGPEGAPLAERHDAVFMGTSIATGTAAAEVVATGMHTELGRIAHLLATAEDSVTPLQRRLAHVSQTLLYICGGVVAAVALAGLWRGWPLIEVFMAAVSLAVAAVPEGLPAVVTIALAVGVQRMAARHALIRRLPAVETLGCATVICTDKTGTLTTGAMRVRELWGADHARLLAAGAACCDAELRPDGAGGLGDPTEVAILIASAARGIHKSDIERTNPRVSEMPFDASTKLMMIERADGAVYIKGAVESVLPLCETDIDSALMTNHQMAERGLRVLAVAVRAAGIPAPASFLGLVGIADPPRSEAIEAVAAARAAGIATVMITGDHPVTARAIATELGILSGPGGAEERVHARATPEDKIGIVRAWKARGAVVAMTGDGVNDAPALREAHIGIAMGLTGTEVTREASDMVLADDNFASIVAAIREGRGIFDNIRKTLVYLLSGNTAELTVMLVAALGGWPLPLLPLHLLWINVVTDGLPALALVVDPPEDDVLQRPPRHPEEPMLGREQWQFIVITGLLQAVATLSVFVWALDARDLVEARNLAFSVLVFGELFRAFAARSTTRVFWEVGAFTNVRLLGVVVFSVLLQLGIHHIPVAQSIFEIGPLSGADCALTLLVALAPVTVIELGKLVRRWVRRQSARAEA